MLVEVFKICLIICLLICGKKAVSCSGCSRLPDLRRKERFTQITRIYTPKRIQDPISGGLFIEKHLQVIGMPVEVLKI